MKKYFNKRTNSEVYIVEFENQKFDKLKYNSASIDYSYFIEEDGVFIVLDEDGNELESFEVKANDVVLKMYSYTKNWKEKIYIKITDPALLAYYDNLREYCKSVEKETEKYSQVAYDSNNPECEAA